MVYIKEKPLRQKVAQELPNQRRSDTGKLITTAVICNPSNNCTGAYELGQEAAEYYCTKGGSELNFLARLTGDVCSRCRVSILSGYFDQKDILSKDRGG